MFEYFNKRQRQLFTLATMKGIVACMSSIKKENFEVINNIRKQIESLGILCDLALYDADTDSPYFEMKVKYPFDDLKIMKEQTTYIFKIELGEI